MCCVLYTVSVVCLIQCVLCVIYSECCVPDTVCVVCYIQCVLCAIYSVCCVLCAVQDWHHEGAG